VVVDLRAAMQIPLNILIVDDDADNAQSLAELFELEGHRVSMVHNGEDAIRAFIDNTYDLAFMDVMMPGKNGVESFIEIKRLKPQARVVMMTGYSVEQLLQQAIENGALGVLTKPMQPKKILDMIAEVGPKGVVVAAARTGSDDAMRMSEVLRAAGHVCHVVRSTADVLLNPPRNKHDVLIYDLHKPLIEGMSMYTDLRLRGLCTPTIILADTDEPAEDVQSLFKDFRATGVLNKPFDPDQLLKKLQQLAA
jgi:two-component system, NtrC family, response regulator HydG